LPLLPLRIRFRAVAVQKTCRAFSREGWWHKSLQEPALRRRVMLGFFASPDRSKRQTAKKRPGKRTGPFSSRPCSA